MQILIGWLVFSFVAGYIGNSRKIGFWSAFFLSLFLSPLVGLLVAFGSDRIEAVKRASPALTKLLNEGEKLFKEGKIDEAILKFSSALALSDVAPNTNFILAKLYCLKEDQEKALRHLMKAIEDGFKDFEKINRDQDLAYLREKVDFKMFVANGYKRIPVQSEARPLSRIEELEKLSVLLEKGLLSKNEFENEKKRILSKEV